MGKVIPFRPKDLGPNPLSAEFCDAMAQEIMDAIEELTKPEPDSDSRPEPEEPKDES